ncbi:MAG TPA: toxin-antitoxin system HicB family antitoxin [Pseudonocardiaceae bacterium]
MDLSPYVAALRDDLTTAASAGDEQTQRVAAVLAAALEPSARLAIMNALSDLAAEVTAALDDAVVEVRLDGRDVRVSVTSHTPEPADVPHGAHHGPGGPPPPPPPPPGGDMGGDVSRITLRLFEELKSQAERAAATQGMSLNSWLSQAVQGALQGRDEWQRSWDPGRRGPGDRDRNRRMRGWVQG